MKRQQKSIHIVCYIGHIGICKEEKTIIPNFYELFLKFKVTHSLPGRFRISVSQLKNVPEEWRVYSKSIIEFLLEIPGIKEINLNYITGTILVVYDPQLISEDKIIEKIKMMTGIIMRHKGQLEKVKIEEAREMIEKMKNLVRFEMNF